MERCYLKDELLVPENRSDEHILLNAIGGILKSDQLLCQTCNSKFGNACDAALAKQLNTFATLFQVKRERGELQPIKGGVNAKGERIDLTPDLKPVIGGKTIQIDDKGNGNKDIAIKTSSDADFNRHLKNLARKYNFDINDALLHVKRERSARAEPIRLNGVIGGDLPFRSIAKSAVNFYILKRGEKGHVMHLLPYLKGEEAREVTHHYYPTQPLYCQNENEIVHIIHLVGNKEQQLLYCFVEFFNTYSFLVKLSDTYTGESFTETHCVDPIAGVEVFKEVSLTLSREQYAEITVTSPGDQSLKDAKEHRAKEIAEQLSAERYIGELVQQTMTEVCAKYEIPEGEKLPPEAQAEFTEKMSLRFVEFLVTQGLPMDVPPEDLLGEIL